MIAKMLPHKKKWSFGIVQNIYDFYNLPIKVAPFRGLGVASYNFI